MIHPPTLTYGKGAVRYHYSLLSVPSGASEVKPLF